MPPQRSRTSPGSTATTSTNRHDPLGRAGGLAARGGIRLRGRPIALLRRAANNLDRRARAACSTWSTAGAAPSSSSVTTGSCWSTSDETVELRSGSATVFGGTFSAYEEHLAVQQAAVAREVRVAEQRHRAEKRQGIEAETTIARRARAGEKAGRSMPKILAKRAAEEGAGDRWSAPDGARFAGGAGPVGGPGGQTAPARRRAPARGAPQTRTCRRHGASRRSPCAGGTPSCRARNARRDGRQRRRQDDVARPARRVPHRTGPPGPDTGLGAARRPDRVPRAAVGTDSTTTPPCSRTSGGTPARTRRGAPETDSRVCSSAATRGPARPLAVGRGALPGGAGRAGARRPAAAALVLDEPTNDLDLTSVDQLVAALRAYRAPSS